MQVGYIDVPASVIIKAYERVAERRDVCKVLPCVRIAIEDNGNVVYDNLVCKGMGGLSTGYGASHCHNCKMEE